MSIFVALFQGWSPYALLYYQKEKMLLNKLLFDNQI